MKKVSEYIYTVKTKIAIWIAPIVLLFYFDEKIQLRDRLYYLCLTLLKSSPVILLYSYFTAWKDKNEMFFLGIGCALFLNMVVGAAYHFSRKTFDFAKFLVKNTKVMLVISVVYFLLAVLKAPLQDTIMGKLFESVIQIMTLMYPTSKAIKNIFILTDGKYPPRWVMKAFYNYEKEGKLKDFFNDINKSLSDNNESKNNELETEIEEEYEHTNKTTD